MDELLAASRSPTSPEWTRASATASIPQLWPRTHAAVSESRIAPLIVYGLIGATVFLPEVLRVIPVAVTDGILTFVGASGLLSGGNQFTRRLLLLVSDPAVR